MNYRNIILDTPMIRVTTLPTCDAVLLTVRHLSFDSGTVQCRYIDSEEGACVAFDNLVRLEDATLALAVIANHESQINRAVAELRKR